MKAWLLDTVGDGIDKLHIADVSDPVPGEGQVVIDLQFAALNPADRYLAENQYPARPAYPHILGRDGMGAISAVGPGVTSLKVGQKVVIITGNAGIDLPGTFAEKLLASVETLGSIPPGWSNEQAAAAPLVYTTAYQALNQWGDLPKASIVLITGASGGVGVAAVQLAKAMGHAVIALSRDPGKSRRLRELGADVTLDPNDPNWKKSVKVYAGRHRVGLAIDSIGGRLLPEVIDTLADHGRVSCVGRLAGPVPEFNTASLFFRRIRIGGVAVHAYSVAEARAAWGEVLALMQQVRAAPVIDSIHPFDQLPKAFARLAQGPMGKVLLAIK